MIAKVFAHDIEAVSGVIKDLFINFNVILAPVAKIKLENRESVENKPRN